MGSTRCIAQSLHRPLLPSEVHYLLKKFLRSFQCRCGFDHWTESRCLCSLDIGKQKTNGKIQSVQSSEWGLKFCWLKHPDRHLTPNINKQLFKWGGHFYGSWFKVSRSQGFLVFIPQIASQHQEVQVCSLFWWALMCKKTGDFKNRPENILIFENCILDDSSSEAFSVFCFNAPTDSSFELTSVDPLNNL